MNIKQTISRLSQDLVVQVAPSLTPCVTTKFFYPNRDSINLYFSQSKGKTIASDLGSTIDSMRNSGLDISTERRQLIEMICRREDIEMKGDSLSKVIRAKSLNEDFLSMCQSLTYVSSLHFHQSATTRSALPESLASLLEKKVKPKRGFEKEWSKTSIDPDGSFPVDYHFNGKLPPRNLFYVTSGFKALLVSAVVQFLRANKVAIPTMAVIDKNADLNEKQVARLQLSTSDLKFGLSGNEKSIVRFVLATN